MMTTKYIIKMKMPGRLDLDYYYRGQGKEGNAIFSLQKPTAKRFDYIEEAYRALSILSVIEKDETLTVERIKCKA